MQLATRLAPDQPRYAYVYGVALNSSGKVTEALRILSEAHKRFSGDMEILLALVTMERDVGHRAKAQNYAQQLVDLAPDDPQAQALLREIGS